jgi:hypothetical protein
MAPFVATQSGLTSAVLPFLSLFLAVLLGSETAGLPPRSLRRSAIRRTSTAGPPRSDHTVIVIMENHAYGDIIGSADAPYINFLRTLGANFTASYGVGHPSEPNYLALFAGTTEGLSDDSCPHTYTDENLATRLAEAGLTFAGYAESMPSDGYTGCDSGDYSRKHNPWVDFTNVPPTANLMFSRFPADDGLLPTVSVVVPNLCNDMHNCSVATGDAWLSANIGAFVTWAMSNNSLLILTFDEAEGSSNQVATLFVGPMVVPGDYAERIDHYAVLRTLEDMYGLPPTGNAASAPTILDVWTETPVGPLQFYTLAPCRVADTRKTPSPYGGPPLAGDASRSFVLAGRCGIPTTAAAVSFNFTVTQPAAAGDLRVFPAGAALPLASALNWSPGQTRASNVVSALGPSGDVTVRVDQASGTVQLIIDVNGYFQ